MIPAGRLDTLVAFERQTMTTDDYGAVISAWSTFYSAWASVEQGTGVERRAAASQSAVQPGTFLIRRNPTAETITVRDRLSYGGATWEIHGVVADRDGIEITATRAA